MLLKILGLIDLLAAVIAVFVHMGYLPVNFLYIFIAYLLLKAVIFIKSLSSIGDLLSGAYLFLMIFGLHTFLVYIVALYLFQKAVFSFAS